MTIELRIASFAEAMPLCNLSSSYGCYTSQDVCLQDVRFASMPTESVSRLPYAGESRTDARHAGATCDMTLFSTLARA